MTVFRGLLHKIVRLETYLPVGTNLRGFYKQMLLYQTYLPPNSYLPVGTFRNELFYATGPCSRTLVGDTLILFVTPPYRFCLGRCECGRMGWAARQDGGTAKMKVNPTQVCEQMALHVEMASDARLAGQTLSSLHTTPQSDLSPMNDNNGSRYHTYF